MTALDDATARLCTFCRTRLSRFLGTHTAHPHETDADTLRRVNDLSGACCERWRGKEPDHWQGRVG